MVTANGDILTTSREVNPDLFWVGLLFHIEDNPAGIMELIL
jgi:hypothetical protein